MKTIIVILSLLFSFSCFSQNTKQVKKPIQLSGVVVSGDSLKSVPATAIKIVKTDSIDYSYFFSVLTDADGFFSLMAKPGDVLEFKKDGFANSRYVVPDTLKANHFSIIQIMQTKESLKDTALLPEVLPRK